MPYQRPIELEPNEVPEKFKRAFPNYTGRKFQVQVHDDCKMSPQNMQWSGGTRSTYVSLHFESGQTHAVEDSRPWPHNMSCPGAIDIAEGWCVVEHVFFCGKDLGLRYHVRPENVPARIEHDDLEAPALLILAITSALKSFARRDEAERHGMSAAQWAAELPALIEAGYLRKNGAITPKGKNASRKCEVRI